MKTIASVLILGALALTFSACSETSLKADVLQRLGLKPTPLESGVGGGAFFGSNGIAAYTGGIWGGTVTFDGDGALTDYTDGAGWSLTGATVSSFGADGIVAWGLWTGGSSSPVSPLSGSPVKVLHYAVSRSNTSTPVILNLVKSYSSSRSSAPTMDNGGAVVTGSADGASGTISINYPANKIDFNISITIGSHSFTISNSGIGSTFLNPGTGNGSFFSDGSVTSSTDSVAGLVKTVPYAPLVDGAVFGSSGERAVLNYGFYAPSVGNVSGAVVFK
jgi:hypothetical protein